MVKRSLQHEIDIMAECWKDKIETEVDAKCPHCGYKNVLRIGDRTKYLYVREFVCIRCFKTCFIRGKHYFSE